MDKWRKIQFSAFPAWIRKSFFGRSTVARIHPSSFGNPHEVLDKWIDSPQRPIPEWTVEIPEIEKRLVWNIGPNEFEHLVVALLQLEQPDRVWRHVGGSGDGGVDGMGVRVPMANPAPLSSASGMVAIQKFRRIGRKSTTLPPCWKTPPKEMTLSIYGIDTRSPSLLKSTLRGCLGRWP